MKTVQDHLTAVLAATKPVQPLDVLLADAAGCILAQDVVVPADLPAIATAGCDGYAVRADEVAAANETAPVALPVVHDAYAGTQEPLRMVPGQAIRISSGAPLPIGADAVVPFDHTDRGTAQVRIMRPVPTDANVRTPGTDARADDVVFESGLRLGARQISLAAALGLPRLRVHPRPRVVILSIGDELREPGQRGEGVFNANGQALAIAVQDAGAIAIRVPAVTDDRAVLREMLEDQLVRADLVLTTGGLSEGERDTLKDVLAPLGTVRFDHVAISPGRQQGFGVVGPQEDEVPIFALPGHPVAAQISYEVFVRPALRAMAGYTDLFRPSVAGYANASWDSPAGVRQFVPAHLSGSPDAGYVVTPTGDPQQLSQLSQSALAGANALAVIGEDDTRVQLGSRVHCLVLDG